MKVLLSAYACEPESGSEPGVGWNWARGMARVHQLWVITCTGNRQRIEAQLAKEPLPSVSWVYFDLPKWLRFWSGGWLGAQVYHYLWQAGAFFVCLKLNRQIHFDLVHHVTYVCYWRASYLPLISAPFVWGPVGGGESAPIGFRSAVSLKGRIYEALRDCARWVGEHDPFVRFTARNAAFALATTDETAKRMRALGCTTVSVLSQVALAAEEIQHLATIQPRHSTPFRVLSVGRLLHWKGFDLGLKAFAQLHRQFPSSEYWLVGEGPERRRLDRLARTLQLGSKVTFWGHLPRTAVLKMLGQCDVLLHPSLHDSGGYVCAEAMAAGRPVVCLELGGPALQVTHETGIKVPAISPDQAIRDLASAMHALAADPELRRRLGDAARQRVAKNFNSEGTIDFMMRIYDIVTKRERRTSYSYSDPPRS